MQPEEIIQQKHWDELTATEKEMVLPLASKREEYELLKNILEVAVEDEEPVPMISAAIHQKLQQKVENRSKKSRLKIFYYSAASIAAILIVGWFVFQNFAVKKEGDIAIVEQPKIPVIDTLRKTKAIVQQKNEKSVKNTIVTIKKKNTNKTNSEKRPIPQNSDDPSSHATQLAVVNTYINSDTLMMAMITEVY